MGIAPGTSLRIVSLRIMSLRIMSGTSLGTAVGMSLAVGIATLFTLVAIRFTVQALRWVPRQERWDRRTRGLCPTCGYDLTGNTSGTCPECGTPIDREGSSKSPGGLSILSETQPWWVWTIVLIAMALTVIVQRLR